MGSRWFKIIFGLMILWVMKMVLGAVLYQPSEINDAVSAEELYQIFQQDWDEAEENYGGEFVTIDGIVAEIESDGDRATGLILTGYDRNSRDIRMVHCKLNHKRRKYSPGDLPVDMRLLFTAG